MSVTPEDEDSRWLPLTQGEAPARPARSEATATPPIIPVALPLDALRAALEQQRLQIQSGPLQEDFGIAAFVTLACAFFAVLMLDFPLPYKLLIGGVSVAGLTTAWYLSRRPGRKALRISYGRRYKAEYVPGVLVDALPGSSYHHDTGLRPEEVQAFFEKPPELIQDLITEDLFVNDLHGCSLRSAHVACRELEAPFTSNRYIRGSGTLRETWNGRLAVVRFAQTRRAKTRIELCMMRRQDVELLAERNGMERLRFNDHFFDSSFDVYAHDVQAAQAILSASLRRALLRIDDVHRGGVEISWRETAIFFYFPFVSPMRAPLQRAVGEAKDLAAFIEENRAVEEFVMLLEQHTPAWQ